MSKRSTSIQHRSSGVRDCDEELEAAIYRKAFSIIAQQEYEQAESTPADEEERRALAELDERMVAAIARGVRQSRASAWKRRMLRAAHVAACLIVVLGIGLSVALAVPSFRQQLYRISADDLSIFTELRLVPNEDFVMDVPEGWSGDYYMAYIPDGYEFYHIYGNIPEVLYLRSEDDYLRFSICDENTVTMIDTENADISYSTVHDCEAMIVQKRGLTTVVWAEADKMFIIDFCGGMETALIIARNVSIINKD